MSSYRARSAAPRPARRTPAVAAWLLALGASSAAAQPPAAAPPAAPPVAQGELATGAAARRALSPPAAHRWSLPLRAGEYAEVEVLQLGVDVVVRLVAPSGQRRADFDATRGPQGREDARWIADADAAWTLELVPVPGAAAGDYEIRWLVRRPASDADRELVLSDSLGRAGYQLSEQGHNAEAEPLLRRSLEIRERLLGPEHLDVATSLRNLALAYDDDGRYADAEPLYRRALAIREKVQGPDHADVGALLNNLAILATLQGRYAEAEALNRRALAVREKALGPDHRDVASSENSLAGLYYMEGRYAEAEPLFQRALAVRERLLGAEHPIVAQNLSNLALLYQDQGRYAEAEPLLRRSLAILEAALGKTHPVVASALINLGDVYGYQQRYPEAEALYRRAIALQEKALGPDHPDLAAALHSLGSMYAEQGRRAPAEPLYRRALAINEKALGADHPDVASIVSDLAHLYTDERRYAEAEPLYRRALAIWDKALGPDHPDVAAGLTSYAYSLAERRNGAAAARPLLDRAIRVFDGNPGRPDERVHAYALRARLRREGGDTAGALGDLAEAIRATEEMRPRVGGDETRAAFFGKFADLFDRMVSWQLAAGDLPRAVEYAERGRARVLLDQLVGGRVDLRASLAPGVRAALEARDGRARARIAEYQQRLTLLRSRKDLADADRDRLGDALEDSLRAADRDFRDVYEEIKSASPLWRTLLTSAGRSVPLDTIQRRLVPADGYLLLYHVGDESSTLFLIPPAGAVTALPLRIGAAEAAALRVRPGALTAAVLARVMGGGVDTASPAAPSVGISELLGRSPRGRSGGASAELFARLGALRRILVPDDAWRRIRSAPEVVVVPGRGLYLLPFEALVAERGATPAATRFWLDDGPAVRYAASAATLYNLELQPTVADGGAGAGAVLSLSRPVFDPAELLQAEAPRRRATPAGLTTRAGFLAGGGGLPPLPGTAAETEAIRRAFSTGPSGSGVTVLQGRDATEAGLRDALAGKRYVHLATHALVDEQRSSLFAALALTPPTTDRPSAENDGFLQLHEIYQLRLPDLALAVLSACETNAGPAVDGEGVFALSRGFHAAGARRVVGSEWAVEDRSTAALMGAFFGEIATVERSPAGGGVDYARALRDAKRAVRREPRWAHPYYWAPFVLTGTR